jgi:ribosomal protein S19
MRSKWKGMFVNRFFFKSNSVIKNVVWSRNSVILPILLGQRVSIYNGRSRISVLIRKPMLSYKIGSFVLTKKLGSQIHQRLKKKQARQIKK